MAEKARFISRYGNYSVGVQSSSPEHLGHKGEMVPRRRRIDAQFYNHLVSDSDLAVAVATFSFPGLPFDEETQSHVSPRFRISVWDSEWARQHEGWDDDEIDMMISKLRSRVGVDLVELDIAAKAPFQNYDNLSVDEIMKVVELTGVDTDVVAAYERENANRKALLDKLAGAEVGDDAVVVRA